MKMSIKFLLPTFLMKEKVNFYLNIFALLIIERIKK